MLKRVFLAMVIAPMLLLAIFTCIVEEQKKQA